MTDEAAARADAPRTSPRRALAVCGVMCADPALGDCAVEQLAEAFGGVDLRGEVLAFDQTSYYEPEMGPELRRFYCSFGDLVPVQRLIELKRRAWAVEQHHLRDDGGRKVNLDPGYLDLNKVVLASFKEGRQKLYLDDGVWADLVLFFQNKQFGPLRWTFPDLRDGAHLPFFHRARQRYKQLLRAEGEQR